MFSRGVALCSIFALATVAQGGVQVQLVPAYCPGGGSCVAGLCSGGTRNGLTCAPAVYPPSAVVQVDVKLAQALGGSDQLLRMVEFDMLTSSPSLVVVLPLTHDKGTPGTGDDINFWSFSSLANCSPPSNSFCGFRHFVDFNLAAGPVDTRLQMLSMAFHGLTAEGSAQIALPATGAAVTVGKMQVAVPASAGTYTLNLMNAADTGADRGARVDFGFDPHVIWRARNAAPDDVTGGTFAFSVCASDPCPAPVGPSVTKWESVITHTRNGIDLIIPLDIPDNVKCTGAGLPDACCTGAGTGTCTGSYSEPRSGVKKIVVTFDGPLNPATAILTNVIRCGNSGPAPGTPTDLSGVVITAGTVAGSGDTKMEINFAPALPDFARYKIALSTNIHGAAPNTGSIQAGTGGLSRILVALVGDANGDRRVTASDLSLVRGLVFPLSPDPIDPAVLNQVRSDTNADKRVTVSDLSAVRGKVGNDARTIIDPVCP